jgi:hypothetical protein
MLWREHDHHRGLRARDNATASADWSDDHHQDRHLMTALQSRNSTHPVRCRSTGHARVRADAPLSPQIARQLAAVSAICRPLINRFIVSQLAGSVRSQSYSSPEALKSP